MKKLITIILILMILLGGSIAYADSNINNAKYISTVRVTNTGTALTNAIVVFTLSTADMISGDYLSATADDVAVLTGLGGSDLPFMPSANSSYPWVTWVNSIGANANLNEYLYSKDVTGGKIRYFPANGGMTTPDDDADFEPGGNFSIELAGYFNAAAAGNLIEKIDAFVVSNDGAGNITATIENATTGSLYPNAHPETVSVDGRLYQTGTNATWAALVAGTGTGALDNGVDGEYIQITAGNSSGKFNLLQRAILVFAGLPENATVISATLSITGNAKLDNLGCTPDIAIYSAAPNSNTELVAGDFDSMGTDKFSDAITYADWSTSSDNHFVFNAAGLAYIAAGGTVRFGVRNANYDVAGVTPPWVNEKNSYLAGYFAEHATADPYLTVIYSRSITASGIQSGERIFKVTNNSADFKIFVDDMVTAKDSTNGTEVPPNTENWTYLEDGVMPYMEYLKTTIGGELRQHIVWEYGTTFNDQTAFNNDATPTFRTTSSDVDLTASVIAQVGQGGRGTPTSNVTGGWTMITSVPNTPSGLFSEGADTYGIGGFNIGKKVTDAATGAGQDPASWHILFAFGLALLALFGTFKVTHNTRMGKRGSLVISTLVADGVMIYFYVMGTIPGFTLIPFSLIAILLIVWNKSPSPVD